jgi:hypothetical protein
MMLTLISPAFSPGKHDEYMNLYGKSFRIAGFGSVSRGLEAMSYILMKQHIFLTV